MAARVLAAPLVLIATAVGQVVEARLSEMKREALGSMASYYLSVTGILLIISTTLLVLLIFLAPVVVPFLLGNGWEGTADIIVALSPMMAARMVGNPTSKILIVLQQATWSLVLDVVRVAAIIGTIIIASVASFSVVQTAWCVSGTFVAIYAFTWIVGWRLSRVAR